MTRTATRSSLTTAATSLTATPTTRTGGLTDAWEGKNQIGFEHTGGLDDTLMGARLYLPTYGQFTAPDPIFGGNPNPYMYPADPINEGDLTGLKGGPRCAGSGSLVLQGNAGAQRDKTSRLRPIWLASVRDSLRAAHFAGGFAEPSICREVSPFQLGALGVGGWARSAGLNSVPANKQGPWNGVVCVADGVGGCGYAGPQTNKRKAWFGGAYSGGVGAQVGANVTVASFNTGGGSLFGWHYKW